VPSGPPAPADRWVRQDGRPEWGDRAERPSGSAGASPRRVPFEPKPLPADLAAEIRKAATTATAHHREVLVGKMADAVAAYERHRFEEAARLAKQVVNETPEVAAVRELAGLAAYRAGRWREGIAQLDAYGRLTGDLEHVPVLMDCHRALGKPRKVASMWSELRLQSPDPDVLTEARMVAAVKAAAKDGDSLGGVAEVLAYGVPVGLGSHVHWDRKLDALLAQALMSIQAVKAVEIGDGWDVAGRRGSVAHDAIRVDDSAIESGGYRRDTTRAGGIEGGMSIGGLVVARAAMKPLATLNRPVLKTVDVVTKEATVSFRERTDVTAVPAMGVVAETMTALVLAGEALRKFGGDSLAEVVRNRDGFVASLGDTPSAVLP